MFYIKVRLRWNWPIRGCSPADQGMTAGGSSCFPSRAPGIEWQLGCAKSFLIVNRPAAITEVVWRIQFGILICFSQSRRTDQNPRDKLVLAPPLRVPDQLHLVHRINPQERGPGLLMEDDDDWVLGNCHELLWSLYPSTGATQDTIDVIKHIKLFFLAKIDPVLANMYADQVLWNDNIVLFICAVVWFVICKQQL